MGALNTINVLTNFDELVIIADSAKQKRLGKAGFRDAKALVTSATVSPTMAFLAKLRIMRKIRFELTGGAKRYERTCLYSDHLICDFNMYTKEYRQCYDLLSDDWSKKIFVNLLAGEMLMDARYGILFQRPSGYLVDIQGAAFFSAGEAIIDCGAYTGDTLQEFVDAGCAPGRYYGFEPDPINCEKARTKLLESGIVGAVYEAAVHKENTVLRFSSDGGVDGRITDDGEISVEALCIDETIKDTVTSIKMDVEGSEYEALEGAALTIKKYKPKLAVCIYHKAGDYRTIPLLIKRLNHDYSEFYIRYLSPYYIDPIGFADVVLYVR